MGVEAFVQVGRVFGARDGDAGLVDGMLIGAIPERSEGEDGVRLGMRGTGRSSAGHVDGDGHSSGVQSTVYRSESGTHNDMSPEPVLCDTPSDSGLLGREWDLDQMWFRALGETGEGFEEHVGADSVDVGDAQCEFDHGRYR
jgi:hypothetical protein